MEKVIRIPVGEKQPPEVRGGGSRSYCWTEPEVGMAIEAPEPENQRTARVCVKGALQLLSKCYR